MKRLNLANTSNSDINYKTILYPDGQQSIAIQKWPHFYLDDNKIIIESRLSNSKDLELIVCTNAALRRLDIEEVHLYVPYILGGRSDRQFNEGEPSYLTDVIAPIINLQGFKTVTSLDSHSYVTEAVIKNYRHGRMSDFYGWVNNQLFKAKGTNLVLICPDAGAQKRVDLASKYIGQVNAPIITCSKVRENGKIVSVDIPMRIGVYENYDFVIVDDLCDGGGTFLPIAKEVKKMYPGSKVYLTVTHGIFSKGLLELAKHFDGIYTTNSYGVIRTEDAKDMRCLRIFNQFDVL